MSWLPRTQKWGLPSEEQAFEKGTLLFYWTQNQNRANLQMLPVSLSPGSPLLELPPPQVTDCTDCTSFSCPQLVEQLECLGQNVPALLESSVSL